MKTISIVLCVLQHNNIVIMASVLQKELWLLYKTVL